MSVRPLQPEEKLERNGTQFLHMIEKSLTAGWLISECLCQTPGLPGGASSEEPACQCGAGRGRLSPWAGRCPGGGLGNPLQRSCLGSPMKAGAWRAAVHGAAQCQDRSDSAHVCALPNSHCVMSGSLSLCVLNPPCPTSCTFTLR